MEYQVIVGNVGTVVDTDDRKVALDTFQEYVWKVVEHDGRAEPPVVLMKNGHSVAEFGANNG